MNTVIEHETSAATPRPSAIQPASVTPMVLLQQAVAQGVDTDKLAALMDLQERWEKNEARKAFVVALNAFKANPPVIEKAKQVSFQTSKGKTEYKHATLDKVSAIIGAALAKHGISHRWEVEQPEGGRIKVTCVLTHALGHSERVPMESKADDSGGKNSIQAVGSAVTYLQRYTLLAASGMATTDQDNDGAGASGPGHMAEEQKADWLAAIDALDSTEAGEETWARIAEVCTEIGDVAAYDELKGAMSRKLKALKAAA